GPRRPAGEEPGRRPGALVAGAGLRPGGARAVAEPGGGAARAGRAAGRRPQGAAGRIRRGDRAAPPRRAAVRRGGGAHGAQRGQRGEALGAGAGAPAAEAGRRVMTESANGRVAVAPPDSAPSLDDPRVVRAVREYLAAIEAGDRPNRS